MDERQFNEFCSHPVRSYDPLYTKDVHLWHSAYSDFKSFLSKRVNQLLESNGDLVISEWTLKDRKSLVLMIDRWYLVHYKIQVFAKATGTSLPVSSDWDFQFRHVTRPSPNIPTTPK